MFNQKKVTFKIKGKVEEIEKPQKNSMELYDDEIPILSTSIRGSSNEIQDLQKTWNTYKIVRSTVFSSFPTLLQVQIVDDPELLEIQQLLKKYVENQEKYKTVLTQTQILYSSQYGSDSPQLPKKEFSSQKKEIQLQFILKIIKQTRNLRRLHQSYQSKKKIEQSPLPGMSGKLSLQKKDS